MHLHIYVVDRKNPSSKGVLRPNICRLPIMWLQEPSHTFCICKTMHFDLDDPVGRFSIIALPSSLASTFDLNHFCYSDNPHVETKHCRECRDQTLPVFADLIVIIWQRRFGHVSYKLICFRILPSDCKPKLPLARATMAVWQYGWQCGWSHRSINNNCLRGATGNEDRRPKVAVIDTGASAIILGISFASHLEKCHPTWLTFGDTFITTKGTKKKSLGHSKLLLGSVLTKGTSEETISSSTVLIADTNSYDMIPGMDCLGPCFGYLDPLT